MVEKQLFTGPARNELGIVMLCAWNNIPREQAPAEWQRHANEATLEAWCRVAEAAISYEAKSESRISSVHE